VKRLAPLTALALVACWLLAAHASASVYWSNYSTSKIGRADSDGQNPNQSLISTTGHPWGVAVDGEHVYWTSLDNMIGRADLDGANPNQSFVASVSQPFGLAVTDQYALWANGGTSTIGISNLALGSPDQSFLSAGGPIGVAADSEHIYWTNWNTNSIGRAELGGGNAAPQFIADASGPTGIAVDSQHIYWANYNTSTIGRADLDGTHVDQSFITAASMPQGVAVDGQHIWWTNIGSSTIGRANLNGTDANQYAIPNASAPDGVAATHVAGGTPEASADALYFNTPGTHTLSVKNDGPRDLQLDAARLDGANAADFSVANDTCSLAVIGLGDSCTIDVKFDPSVTGNRLASITFPDNGVAPIVVSLSGTTQAPPVDPAPSAPATPQSTPGTRHSVIECGLNGGRTRATCVLKLSSTATAQVRWRLVRRGRLYRHGVASASGGRATIKLGGLRRGRYLLHADGLEQVTPIAVRRAH
jgi:streptogramin lyase